MGDTAATDSYRVLLSGGEGEIVEKKSRFIATIRKCETEEEAVAFIEEMKKKYWDARHNCSAFIIGSRGELTRCSDDGEPSGTAGRPMLEVLTGSGIRNIAVVVTRYFGGVKLGAGGLVRAYGGAANDILAVVPTCKEERAVDISVKISYANFSAVTNILSVKALTVNNVFDTDVTVCATVKVEDLQQVLTAIRDAVNGQAVFSVGEEYNLRI